MLDTANVPRGLLSLCEAPPRAVAELCRVTRPGAHMVCDAANRWRTGLELARGREMAALMRLLDTGLFHRRDGLTDHRFEPRELGELFAAYGMELLDLAALCPFYSFPPREAEAGMLDDPKAHETMLQVAGRYAEDPAAIALTGRLLVVAQGRGSGNSGWDQRTGPRQARPAARTCLPALDAPIQSTP